MAPQATHIKTGLGFRLNIELGGTIWFKFNGDEHEHKSTLVGLEPAKYLIVRAPLALQTAAQAQEYGPLLARYFASEGTYTFNSSILHFVKKYQLFFLAYPETLERHDLRQEPRFDCNLRATAKINGAAFKGFITDISYHGCRFIVNIPAIIKLQQIKILTDIQLAFALMGESGPVHFQGKVRNTNVDRQKITMGIEFDKLSEQTAEQLEEFIGKLEEANAL